ncbi:MFS transporter, partial [Reyranella sp.]|uniref:MFS transporter n=1 Tax=Reyranella sp. TaxID=1929291 RepID=UPI003D0A6CD7
MPARTAWGLVSLLVAAGIVGAFNVGKAPPALPSIRDELGATLSQAGWILSILNLTTALSGVVIALTAARIGHRRLVLAGTALCLAASLLGAFAGSIEVLMLTRIAEGLGFIATVVAAPPLLLRLAAAH